MRLAAALALALVPALGAIAAAALPATPDSALAEGRLAYERGDYPAAVGTIRPLLYPTTSLDSEEAVVEAHRLLALAYIFENKTGLAEQEVSSLLALRPGFQLDPVVDPPVAVSFFQSVRRREQDKLNRLRERKAEDDARAERQAAKEKRAHAERIYIERTVEKHNRLIALIPFGVGQFQNHQYKKGIAFAVSEGLFGAAWAGLTLAIADRYPSRQVAANDQGTADTLTALQIATGAAFWASVAWGVLDAQLKYVPEVVTTRELVRPPAKKGSPISFAPILSPGMYGLGAHGAF